MDSIKFRKYQGAGNDFIVTRDVLSNQQEIAKICHRQYGIGADGLIILRPSAHADIRMHIFNPDGKEAPMCGNGLRCVIKDFGRDCTIETESGICEGKVNDYTISATLPKAQILESNIDVNEELTADLVDTGTKHLVIFVNSFENLLMEKASLLRDEYDANVNFAIKDENRFFVRTYEKGVENETLACGTGGAAVALLGEEEKSEITFLSGESAQYHIEKNKTIWMEGRAELVFEGTYYL